jgi:porin
MSPRVDHYLAACALAFATNAVAADAEPARAGIQIDASYVAESWRQVSGGLGVGERFIDGLELTFALERNSYLGASRLFAAAVYNSSSAINDLNGSMQGVSNLEATPGANVPELWFEQRISRLASSLRVGLYDVNSEFDSIESASLFLNPSHSMGGELTLSGMNGPSVAPETSLGIRADTQVDAWTMRMAIVDGVPGRRRNPNRTGIHLSSADGALVINELDYTGQAGARAAVGYWRYTGDFEDLENPDRLRDDNAGIYALAETPSWQLASGELQMFVRAGEAEPRINAVSRYVGAGGVFSTSRFPDAQWGLAIAIAELGDAARRALRADNVAVARREIVSEFTFSVAHSELLAVQIDVQHTHRPGMNRDIDDGWSVGLRLELAASWYR